MARLTEFVETSDPSGDSITDPKTNDDIAHALSEHRVDEAVDRLSEHVVWSRR